jgi:hypothetical protein
MARLKAGDVAPLLEGWLVWDWFLDDARASEHDEKDKDTGKVGSKGVPKG